MTPMDPQARRVADAINRAALLVTLAVAGTIGVLWWRGAHRVHEAPRWPASGAVALAPPAAAGRAAWIMAVNPDCLHCRERLGALAAALPAAAPQPVLGVLLVDLDARPDSLAGGARFAAGVWWDSAATWRRRWGHTDYAEVLEFAPGGALLRVLDPDSAEAEARR